MTAMAVHRAVVVRAERLSPGMIRVVLGGDGLDGFASTGVGDEYLRMFFPHPGETEPVLPVADGEGWRTEGDAEPAPMRTYTVRSWDEAARELAIDVVVHDGGVAAAWALAAAPGDVVGVNTPKGLHSPPAEAAWQLLVADATGVPAALRILEGSAGLRTRAVLEVASTADELPAVVPADAELHWVHGGNGTGPTRVEDIVRAAELPDGPGYVWVAGETKALRGVRRYLRHELGLPASAYKVIGYWTPGAERWRETYDALPTETRERLQAMWADDARDVEEITDDYEAALERVGL